MPHLSICKALTMGVGAALSNQMDASSPIYL